MGRSTGGVYRDAKGVWKVDKVAFGVRLQGRFDSYQEANQFLIHRAEELRRTKRFGERPRIKFSEAAARYLADKRRAGLPSVTTDVHLLDAVIPFVGEMELSKVHDATLRDFVADRLKQGRSHKTINNSLSVVRRILNLAARSWRDEDNALTWLETAPLLTLLPLAGHQREPRPITWAEQRGLLPLLPAHLGKMALFVLNTGVRDDVACNVRWSQEVQIDGIGSVFVVPREHVKGRRAWRCVVCNSVAQRVVDSCRGMHSEFVFVWRRERVKNTDIEPTMAYSAVDRMNNTAWRTARKKAALGDLHVHDLRHTTAVRLREAGIGEATIADVLWHSKASVTQHYARAQLLELRNALELIADESKASNKLLMTLAAERAEKGTRGSQVPSKSLQQEKGPRSANS
jgi:integrase